MRERRVSVLVVDDDGDIGDPVTELVGCSDRVMTVGMIPATPEAVYILR